MVIGKCSLAIPVQQIAIENFIRRGFKSSYAANYNTARTDLASKASGISPLYHAKSGHIFRAAGTAFKKPIVSSKIVQKGVAHSRAIRQTIGGKRN